MGEDYAVSFLDLIDVLIAGRFRDCGVKMRVVRSAYQLLGRQLGTNHPFCHNDLYTDGRDIFLRAADSIGDETLSEVISRQQFFIEILLPHLKRIEYSDETSLARRWQIFNRVVIDPEIAFGKPILSRTNTTTYVVASAYHANNEDVPLVADLFDLTEEDVRSAVAFEAEYGVRHAA